MATQAEHGAQLSAAGKKPAAAAAGLLLVRTLFLRCSCVVRTHRRRTALRALRAGTRRQRPLPCYPAARAAIARNACAAAANPKLAVTQTLEPNPAQFSPATCAAVDGSAPSSMSHAGASG